MTVTALDLKPEITPQIGGYTFVWTVLHLKVRVSRLHVHSRDDRVTGELLITTDAAGFGPVLYPPSAFTFSAPRTRKELVKDLTDRYDNKLWDWTTIIDQLAQRVQELARAGEPVQEIWTHDSLEPVEILLDPVLIKGVPTIIYGEKGVAKSTLALVFYICLVLPWDTNPLGLTVPNHPVKTLILDWEVDSDIIHRNAKALQVGMELEGFPIWYRRCSRSLANDIEQIQHHVSEVGAEVVIIDSLGQAAGGELKDPQSALDFFTALRQLKVTSLIIAQTSKDTESKHKRVYGSTFFEYYARNIFEMCKAEQGDNEDHINVALFHRWCNLAKLHRPMGFTISFTNSGTKVESRPIDIDEFREKVSNRARILDLLKHGALSPKEIMDELEIKRGSYDNYIKRLRDQNKIRLVDGKWGLAGQEEIPL